MSFDVSDFREEVNIEIVKSEMKDVKIEMKGISKSDGHCYR